MSALSSVQVATTSTSEPEVTNMTLLPRSYKAMVFEKKGEPLVPREVHLRMPSATEVLVKVVACGVCHSDNVAEGDLFGYGFPRVPGHEIIGDIAAVGEAIQRFKVGDRVGGQWHGGHCGICKPCQRSQFQMCPNRVINGTSRDGGYAEYVLLRGEATVRVPRDVDPVEYAPILCAGLSVFNSMRKLNIPAGELVAVQGLGGLGHLAVQYASRMGFRVAALSRGPGKERLARQLGAHEYVDTARVDASARLREMGGAAMVCCTAPHAASIGPLTAGIQAGGHLLVLAPVGNIEINTFDLINNAIHVSGFPSGHALDSEEAIGFAKLHGIKCMVERFSLDDAQKAYDHMLSGDVRFRSVIVVQ